MTVFSGETDEWARMEEEPTPTSDYELIEQLIIHGFLDETIAVDASLVRQALEAVYARHIDAEDDFRLDPEGIKRYSDLDARSFSVTTLRLDAVEKKQLETDEPQPEQGQAAVTVSSIIGERVLAYVLSQIPNLDDKEWDMLEEPGPHDEIIELCGVLMNQGVDQMGLARLRLVAETVGARLVNTPARPIAFIRDGKMSGVGRSRKASY